MKLRKKNTFIFLIAILSFCIIVFCSMTYGWVVTVDNYTLNLTGYSIPGYFAGGNGEENTPYLITKPIHLYNLSWLQAKGKFTEKTFFRLDDNIDMAGTLKGNTNSTGAIPPIGTVDNPFIGQFDGNGNVIKNLWVSSNPADWKEQPNDISSVNVGDKIGFFGSIDQVPGTTPVVGVATNFVLENIEVTSNVANSKVGIIAGYLNGDMSYVGVDNGKISLVGSSNKDSQTVLVGELGGAVEWEDIPESLGGHVLINPNDEYTHSSSSGPTPVPNSSYGSAYFCGNISKTISSPSKGLGRCNIDILWQGNTSNTSIPQYSSSKSNYTAISKTVCPEDVYPELHAAFAGTFYYLDPQIPTTSDLVSLPSDSVIGNLQVPNNGIWFKPNGYGKCSFVIVQTNSSNSSVMSLYSYKRTNSGAIDTSTWRELKVCLTKNAPGNGTGVIFDIQIPEIAITDGYEFVVGRSSGDTNPSSGFAYLILAGTGNVSLDDGQRKTQVSHLDYVGKLNSNGDYAILNAAPDGDYTPAKVLFNFSTTNPNELFFRKPGYNENNNTKVLYYYNSSTIEVINAVASPNDALLEPSTTNFPPRDDSL